MSQHIIDDESVLDTDGYVPEKMLFREEQIREITKSLLPIKNGRTGTSLLVHGPPGVGKTSACKLLLRENFPKNYAYVSCWYRKSMHQIIASIMLQMGHVVHGRESTAELVQKFEKLGRRIIVCLDESDHIRDHDVFYVLARSQCSLILISNHTFSTLTLDSRIKSSLMLKDVAFKPYTADEILQILKYRANACMNPGALDSNILSVISRACNGDARIALQSLRIAAVESEANGKETIGIEELKIAIKAARKYRSSYLIGKLSEPQKIIFDILKGAGEIESGKLFKEYCRKSGSTQTDRTYRNNVKRLVELGLAKEEGSGRWRIYEPYS